MASAEPFVGRDDELAALAGDWSDARAGRPSLVLVCGEAGIGKTALIRRFLDTATPGARVLRAACDAAEVGLPFGVVGQLAADLPAAVRGPLLRSGPPAAADPLAVGAELLTALGELQGDRAVAVVVDDAQWVDDPSARALAFAARRLRRDLVLVLLGVRSPEAPEQAWWDRVALRGSPPRRIELVGLGAEEMVALGAAVGGHALTPEAAGRLAAHTGGHPMHAASLLRELSAPALLDVATPLPAPRSLTMLVLVRVAALSRAAQDLVLAAAVLGSHSPVAHAVALAGPADPVGALDEAVRAGLLTEVVTAGRRDVAFSHQLIRAAVYGDIPPGRRHALHRAAAELVGGAGAVEHRVVAAVGADAALAAELAALAADERAAGRWRSAADHLLSAADLSTTPAERATRLVAGVDTMLAGGDIARALRREAEVRTLQETPARSRVLGRLEALTGRFRDARGSLTAALSAPEDDAGRASAAAHLALLSFIEGDADAAAELAARALEWSPPPEDVSVARFVRMVAEVVRRGPGAVLPAPSGEPTVEETAMRGVLALWREDAVAAADVLSAVVRDGSAGMSMQGRVLLLAHLGEAEYRTGDWDAAAAHGEMAVSL